MSELPWIKKARAQVGVHENTNPSLINSWLTRLKGAWLGLNPRKVPWCGTFVAQCLDPQYPITEHWYRASDWVKFGVKLDRPAYGCIAVFKSGSQYHVTFIVGVDQRGNFMCLGGNQNNQVKISPFKQASCIAMRWPSVWPKDGRFILPLLNSDGIEVTTR